MKPSFCTDNKDISCFLVTKLSWKGKYVFLILNYFLKYFFRYRRIFSIGTLAITTYNPQTLEITNQVFLIKLLKLLITLGKKKLF